MTENETERPRAVNEVKNGSVPRAFLAASALLIALTLAFYWLGWRSPWATASRTVRLEVVDPPTVARAPRAASPNRPAPSANPNPPSTSGRSGSDQADNQQRTGRLGRTRHGTGDSE